MMSLCPPFVSYPWELLAYCVRIRGITYCSPPETLYWFNPVAVLLNELLAGATITLPSQVIDILAILRIASQIMFGFFLTGCVMAFLLIFVSLPAVYSRWLSLPITLLSFIATACEFPVSHSLSSYTYSPTAPPLFSPLPQSEAKWKVLKTSAC